ncbi:hypothetical protein QQS21_005886 [Conoideocrella luteorostrata]|uniref:Uncharacterized protein n=1 Tax=Conoideocrella luteorostrata TaxID=1105319 RepID=A0AAJ0CNK6_9HYPO|nr:hypothetical protein QQS21_005886 [Conoideocrella luteorostrata]
MKFTGVVSAIIASACLVSAAPVEDAAKREMNLGGAFGPLGSLLGSSGLGAAAQGIVAEFFKGGDAILNIPGDAIGNFIKLNPGATLGDIMKFAGSLPGDAAKIGGDLMGGGKKAN